MLILFLDGYSAARLAGYWRSDLTDAEYSYRIRNLDRPEYGQPGWPDGLLRLASRLAERSV